MKPSYRTICNPIIATIFLFLPTNVNAQSADDGASVVFIRHGEKPEKLDQDIGQLNCKGLNRSLALPPVISKLFGKPNFLFVPNPSHSDDLAADESRGYVRALATIEPTAISFGLPVNAALDVSDLGGLQAAIDKIIASNRSAFVLVAWEHKRIPVVVRALLSSHGGDSSLVPNWHGDDFESIYIVTIGASRAAFSHKYEGLSDLPDACPH
jgi:hypothetical protein